MGCLNFVEIEKSLNSNECYESRRSCNYRTTLLETPFEGSRLPESLFLRNCYVTEHLISVSCTTAGQRAEPFQKRFRANNSPVERGCRFEEFREYVSRRRHFLPILFPFIFPPNFCKLPLTNIVSKFRTLRMINVRNLRGIVKKLSYNVSGVISETR